MQHQATLKLQQDYTDEFVPETYRFFKHLKDYKYFPATEERTPAVNNLENVSIVESVALEKWATGFIENIDRNIIPTLKRSKDEISREIKVIDKVSDIIKKYCDNERVSKQVFVINILQVYFDKIETMASNLDKLANLSLNIFEHKK